MKKNKSLVSLDLITSILKRNLSRSRFGHSVAVAELSQSLAKQYGWDADLAYRCGLLHDCCKEWPPQKLAGYARKNKIKIPAFDFIVAQAPQLLHAYVGAHYALAQRWIGSEECRKAISSHTLGSPKMTLPEKILFVADFSSKDRKFGTAKMVRDLASVNLDKAFMLALEKKIHWNLMRKKAIHPIAIEVWNDSLA